MHKKVIQKEKKWLKTLKSPMFRGSFRVPNMSWQVQKLVLLTAADMIDQKNQMREVAECQKYSKTAAEVEKKLTTFGEISVQDNVNHMFIRYIISPPKTHGSITEVNCVKISSFRENINLDRTTFLLDESRFLLLLPRRSEMGARFELLSFSLCIGEY